MSALFTPFKLKDLNLRNRIAVPPMCQYMAVDGKANEWHLSHYASIARGGAGLVIVEATAVAPEGRITPGCTGIWSDPNLLYVLNFRIDQRSGGSTAPAAPAPTNITSASAG